MKKTIILALFAAMVGTGASAKDVSFHLLDSNGDPLCETFVLHQQKGVATGIMNGCNLKQTVGGLYGGARDVSNGGAWTLIFRETPLRQDDTQFVVILNEQALTYTAYSQLDGSTQYSFLTAGLLQDIQTSPAPRARWPPCSITRARASAKPVEGVTVHYTFAGPKGDAYCDGLTITQIGNVATGTHTANSSCPQDHYAGGNFGHVKAVGEKVWTIVTTDTSQPSDDLMYVIDENNMTWTEYAQGAAPFAKVDSGVLLLGDPTDGCAPRLGAHSGRSCAP